jgi:cell division septal protein FtsQ
MNNVTNRRQERQRKKQQRNMLLILVSGGLLLIAAAIIIGQTAWANRPDPSLIEVSGQPSLKVDQELIDYGDVKLNTNLTFDLQLTNVGDEDLKISETPYVEVKEGC